MEEQKFIYAGFWRRVAAYLIDQLILGAVIFVFLIPFYLLFGIGIFTYDNYEGYEYFSSAAFQHYSDHNFAAFIIAMIFFLLIIGVLSTVISWLYYALMESSAKQATLGKMALGIIVTDMEGNRITFGRATGRYFGKILSYLILDIGYIMVAFTEKKQGLHDILANCLVIIDTQNQNYQSTGGYSGSSQQNISN